MPERALLTAASGMYAQQLNIETIANNIANINTTGFKKNKAEFKDLMYQEVLVNPLTTDAPGIYGNSSDKIQIGNGVQPASTQKIFKQGDITATNNQFDIAIQGDGFFQVRKDDGTLAYTRDGSFKVNADGKMVTSSGYILDPDITIDDNTTGITISKNGTVEAQQSDGKSQVIGNIELVRFMNPGGLKALGDNLYSETEASGRPIIGTPASNGFGELNQGFLESSNVDIVEEMVAMISAQRAYEINSKTVQTVQSMMTITNDLKR